MQFKKWVDYFRQNAHRFEAVNWRDGNNLTSTEKKALAYSIRQFQKGEESEGDNLKRMSLQLKDSFYSEAIEYFIREEQQHAAVLGRFLDINGIERLQGHWIDHIFIKLRRFAGLELALHMLLTAELVASVYYRALMNASGNIALRQICSKILRDEEMHIHFQCSALRRLYRGKSAIRKFFSSIVFRSFYLSVCMLIAIQHRSVLRAGGMGMFVFMSSLIQQFNRAGAMMNGRKRILIRRQGGIRLRGLA